MFWIICAALVAVVAIAIVAPLMRARGLAAEPAAAFDLRIYRDQLREVERDLAREVRDAVAPAEVDLRDQHARDAHRRQSAPAGCLPRRARGRWCAGRNG